MSYIENTLLENEKIVLLVRPHWVVFMSPVVVTVCVIVFFSLFSGGVHFNIILLGLSITAWLVLAGLFFILYALASAYITFYFSEYGVTSRRVLMKTGMIQRNSLELFVTKIEAIHVDQSIIARLLGYGTLVVIGTGGSRDCFRWVPNPLRFRHMIQQRIDKELEKV